MLTTLGRRRFLIGSSALAAGALAAPAIVHAQSTELNIMGTDPFLPKDIRDRFTAETGVRINLKQNTDASQTFNLLSSEGEKKSTDMAVIAGHRLYSYIAVDVIDPIDAARLPAMSVLNPLYSDNPAQFINGQRYGVPIAIGFNLIATRKGVVSDADADSWSSVFEDTYAGRVTMRPGSALYAALFYRGMQDAWLNYDGDPEPVEKAFAELREYVVSRKGVLRKWYSTTTEVQQLMLGNEVDVAQGLNEGIVPLVLADPSLAQGVPKEGAMGWTMNYSLIKGGANQDNAYRFIDFLLSQTEAAASMVRSSGNISTFQDTTTGLTEDEIRAYSFGEEQLKRITWLDVKGADDTRYMLLDKYSAGLMEA